MAVSGWPFLVARGRQRGYSVLLAPDFLVAQQDYGWLEDAAGPLPAGVPCRTATEAGASGTRFGLAWAGFPTGLRDEHSRPLTLIAGFVCPNATIGEPAAEDIGRARTAAVATYERFLADEHRFTVEPAAPFRLSSPTAPLPEAPSTRTPRPSAAVLGAAACAVLALVLILVFATRHGAAQPPRPCPPAPTAGVPFAAPAPTTHQPVCVRSTIQKGQTP